MADDIVKDRIFSGEPVDEDTFDDEQVLSALLEASRTPEGRSSLASTSVLSTTLRSLPSSPPSLLLPRLRLVRNLCAGEPAAQDSFLAAAGPDRVATSILGPPMAPMQALRVGLQVLGNAVLAGEAHKDAVWARFFPSSFLDLACVRMSGVCDPLCMVIDTCCSGEGGRRRIRELCEDGRGLPVVVEIVSTASTVGYQEEWLEWLLCKICIEEPYLAMIFLNLGTACLSDGSDEFQSASFTREQAFLLGILSNLLNARPGDVMLSLNFSIGVLKLLREASSFVDFTSRGSSPLPTNSPAIDVLGYSMTILRDICAWEGPSVSEVHVNSLLLEGLLELLLGFLSELEPPSVVRKAMAKAQEHVVCPATEPMKVCPYQGFRRDVVSVISNCVHRRKQVQDKVRELGGIPILLQQCVVDEDNPFVREWGLLAIRNLLEGNEENQREIAELQLQVPVSTAEVDELGLRVEIDEKSGRAKLVNNS